ncbi:hypothetical protein ACP0AK_04885 [Listeria ivanovii]|uniref:Uncharacterized protein n=2 Tax=Listeria ivanovii TaxID=1638 RepID=G2ZDA5_LISIP|nr:hypothetical protein [Listeria ivanovii]AHI57255.1 hypothetical protein AX25_04040 [Listeria ivanovii WSLC3009]AIS64761.1 hypothetical protein JL52_03965 [Listeria ivanovii subsp. ivanovii]MBC1758537.1 hypothetical protein [Listeria ivanovii]MBK3913411.1 hypothetical protein [Listeria ivanovii subsp. ivanovii]MBK3920471.1 hypothetical protein [Listeria ivanovii subsp. ivanovii]
MKEYRFLKYSINLATILVMSMIIFLIGIFLSFTIFSKISTLQQYGILLGLIIICCVIYYRFFFPEVFIVNKNAFYHKKGFSNKKYSYSKYYVECDKKLHYNGQKSFPSYRVYILDLKTEKEKIINIFDGSRKYKRTDLKMKKEICQFSDYLREVQS